MLDNFLQYLDSIKFFSPSEELTEKISRRIDAEIFTDLKQAKTASEESSSSTDDMEDFHNENPMQWMEQESFNMEGESDRIEVSFLASRDYRSYLQQRDLDQMPAMISLEMPKTDPAKLSRFISEQIYHLLASVSREEEVKKGGKVSISKIFNEEEFSEVLGLPEDEPLLNKLSEEFDLWITKKEGSFVTEWGEIISCEKDNFYLVSYYDW